MLNAENKTLCWNIIAKYGVFNQRQMVIEECSELQKAVCKLARHETDEEYPEHYKNYLEEICDVIAVIQQMLLVEGLTMDDVNTMIKPKLERALRDGK